MPTKQFSLDVTQLDNFVYDMSRCIKCKGCYWVEHTYMPGVKFSTRCPSNTWNDFDSYGAFGKMRIGMAVAEGNSSGLRNSWRSSMRIPCAEPATWAARGTSTWRSSSPWRR